MRQETARATRDPAAPRTKTAPGRRSCADGHPADQLQVCKKRGVGGGIVWVRQCLSCKKQIGGTMPLSRVLRMIDPRTAPWYDKRAAHRPQPTKRKRNYKKSLSTARYRKLCEEVLERDNYSCQVIVNAGGEICAELTREVGHLTYERFGNERKEDLQAQCRTHNLREKERRITRHVLGG